MKMLNQEQRERMKSKRLSEMLLLYDIAEKLNCKSSDISAAQTGKPIHDEVYTAIIDWLG